MTVAHKDLTGTDLHEIKGASTATVSQVPIADGVGGAPFGLITPASLLQTANAFGANLFHVQEKQNNGIASQNTTPTSGIGAVQVLNTVATNEITGASRSGNSVVLPGGTYYFEGMVTYQATNTTSVAARAQAYLRNSSAGVNLLYSGAGWATWNAAGASLTEQRQIFWSGRFTLVGTNSLNVYLSVINGNTPGYGGAGDTTYTDLKFWKIA